MEETKHCKWYNDEFCTNGDSPCVADYCPVVEYPELCKCREKDLVKEKSKEVNDLVKEKKKLNDNEKNERSPFLMCEDYDAYLESMSKTELLEYFHFVMGNYKHALDEAALENDELQKQVDELKDTLELQKTLYNRAREDGYGTGYKSAVKDTVKEMAEKLLETKIKIGNEDYVFADNIKVIAKQKGVEVE